MTDDVYLLRQYVETGSETAFAELVQRHIGLVYHAAVRQLGSERHLAEDVVQGVFVLLAEKSPTLLGHPSLTGWLYTATHFKVGHMRRAERRRQARDTEALAMSDLIQSEPAEENWAQVRAVLDAALLELNSRDREAVLLRYFQNRSMSEIAAQLCVSEGAAYKCVERALDRLRSRLARRGVASTAAALGAMLGQQSAFAVPTGLAASVTSTVTAAGLPLAATGGFTFMSLKTTVGIAALVIALGSGIATHEVIQHRQAGLALADAEREVAALQGRLREEDERIARERAVTRLSNPVPVPASARPVAAAPATPSLEEQLAQGDLFLKAHPEIKATLATHLKTALYHQYADLFAEWGMTEAEIDRVLMVLSSGRMRQAGNLILRLNETQTPADYTRALKEALGETRYQQFNVYRQQAEHTRSFADELTRSVYHSSPLAPAQIAQFKQMVDEVLAKPGAGPRDVSLNGWMAVPAWQEVLKRAEAILSPLQIEALTDMYRVAAFDRAHAAARQAYHAGK